VGAWGSGKLELGSDSSWWFHLNGGSSNFIDGIYYDMPEMYCNSRKIKKLTD
jgi:hypothetical protein